MATKSQKHGIDDRAEDSRLLAAEFAASFQTLLNRLDKERKTLKAIASDFASQVRNREQIPLVDQQLFWRRIARLVEGWESKGDFKSKRAALLSAPDKAGELYAAAHGRRPRTFDQERALFLKAFYAGCLPGLPEALKESLRLYKLLGESSGGPAPAWRDVVGAFLKDYPKEFSRRPEAPWDWLYDDLITLRLLQRMCARSKSLRADPAQSSPSNRSKAGHPGLTGEELIFRQEVVTGWREAHELDVSRKDFILDFKGTEGRKVTLPQLVKILDWDNHRRKRKSQLRS